MVGLIKLTDIYLTKAHQRFWIRKIKGSKPVRYKICHGANRGARKYDEITWTIKHVAQNELNS